MMTYSSKNFCQDFFSLSFRASRLTGKKKNYAPRELNPYRFSHCTHCKFFKLLLLLFSFNVSIFPVNVFHIKSLFMLKCVHCDIRVRSGSLEHFLRAAA